MDSYFPDSVSKLSLTVSVGQAAKTSIVAEHGIGEELSMNVMGWRDGKLVCVAQMDSSWGSNDEDERIDRTATAYMVLRRGWGCDSFTVIAEGFVSRNPEQTKDMSLIEAYLDPTKNVMECLTVNYVDADTVDICAVPFRIDVGKKVKWGPVMHSEDTSVLRNNGFIMAAQDVLSQEEMAMPQDIDTFHLALAVGLHEQAGYFLQTDI